MNLQDWSWLFLLTYIAMMVGIGLWAQRRVAGADDFATARGGYGPGMLAFAFAATTASGATFIGMPALAYKLGFSLFWYAVLYPIGVYVGVFICLKLVSSTGNRFGSRSIPEFLGERYQSDAVRILTAIFSLLLLFYLAGQLVAGLVMFERMLGLSAHWALLITTAVLLCYISLGGAHADILTDGVQGLLMVIVSVVVFFMFLSGFGLSGGFHVRAHARFVGPLGAAYHNRSAPVLHLPRRCSRGYSYRWRTGFIDGHRLCRGVFYVS